MSVNTAKKESTRKRASSAEDGAKRKYDSEDTKRRLLRAGINVFSKQGYDAATTREIAKQANVNLSLIPRYYENKLGLLIAIVREFHICLANDPPYPACATLQEELTQFFRFRMEFAKRNRKLMRVIISRSIVDPKTKEELGALVRVGMPWITARLEALRAKGEIRKDADIEKATSLIGGIAFAMSMFTEIVFNMDPVRIRGVLDEAAVTVCTGLCPARAKQPV